MPKRISIFTVVSVFVVTLSGLALASPPVPPPVEGFAISTACDVEVAGDLIEEEGFTWTYVDEMMNDIGETAWTYLGFPFSSVEPLFLAPGGRGAQVRYIEELDSADSSLTQFKKGFLAQSHGDQPNVNVNKDFGYVASGASLITYAEDKERLGLGIVAHGNDSVVQQVLPRNLPEAAEQQSPVNKQPLGGGDGDGWLPEPPLEDIPSLCPWAQGEIPATNEFIAAGSSISTTSQMVSRTESEITSTGPPELNHGIDAAGTGRATAQMKVHLMEGDDSVGGNFYWDGDSWAYSLVIPDLISETVYDEKSSAEGGIDKFTKAMHYHSTIPSWQLPEPWYQLP